MTRTSARMKPYLQQIDQRISYHLDVFLLPNGIGTMSSADLLVKINSLPVDVRRQVIDFMDLLLQRRQQPEPPKKKRVEGLMKGQMHIADDFDAPSTTSRITWSERVARHTRPAVVPEAR